MMARLRAARFHTSPGSRSHHAASETEMANYKYQAVPTDQNEALPARPLQRPPSRRLPLLMFLLLGLLAGVFVITSYLHPYKSKSCDDANVGFKCRADISHSWGQYSAYYAVPSDISPKVPKGCHLNFVQFLSRHGGRHPTAKKTTMYADLVEKLKSTVTEFPGRYSFIDGYEYKLGADDLTPVGRQQMVNSGVKFFKQYESLTLDETPFIRVAGQERVVDSATNWTAGFHSAVLDSGKKDPSYPYPMIIIPEDGLWNNTLNHGQCPLYEDGPYREKANAATDKWRAVFVPPIRERLQTDLPGLDLSLEETHLLMDLCPFETIAHPSGQLSRWCDLFTAEEWEQYDYAASIGKWYGPGPGNPLGPTQGVGFVNELIARLTNRPVEDDTNTNRTLDSDPKTFPLGRALYADFSHDNDMMSVFGALDLFSRTDDLANATMQSPLELKGYSASLAVPFAARVSFEKMECADEDGELVRVLLNDRVAPLQNCGADKLGRCTLDAFIESLGFARNGGRWSECYEDA